MKFLGQGGRSYPQLRLAEMDDPDRVYQDIVGNMELLFQKARLIHADLSEYNILLGDVPYFIDMGQSVTPDHPRALQFLVRDIANVSRFFRHYCHVIEEREVFDRITRNLERED
jgi:RIO kinase 1